ncbi:MAG: hypothetical protein EXQ94_04565 [Alphaproteobacteria bacterium]|nr:hypothetical protein [Alphaproteobacteria bacterium]
MNLGERYFSRIGNDAQAEGAMHAVALGYYVLAALQAVSGSVMSVIAEGNRAIAIVDTLLIFLAFNMQRSRSRVFAVGLMLAALLALSSTILTRMGLLNGGADVFLAVASVYLAGRAVYATTAYHRRRGSHVDLRIAAIKNLVGLALFGVFGLLVGAADDAGMALGPQQPTLLSMILLLSVMVYSLAFASWFPWLGRRSIMQSTRPTGT